MRLLIAALALAGCASEIQTAAIPADDSRPSMGARDTGIESRVTRETRNGTTTVSWNEPLRAR